MSYSDPIGSVFTSDSAANRLLSQSPPAAQVSKQIDSAKNAEELLDSIEQSGVAWRMSDERATQLASSAESNNGELTVSKLDALKRFESKTGVTPTESQYEGIADVKDLAKYLSADEIESAEGYALLAMAEKMVRLVNETGPEAAPAAVEWLKKVEEHLAAGGALDSSFILGALNQAIMIIAVDGARITAQTQFNGFFDPTDPSSQRQTGDVMATDGAMQDSE